MESIYKPKVLFHCRFGTPFIQAVTIICTKHKDDDAVLLVYNGFEKSMEINPIFNKVIKFLFNGVIHSSTDKNLIEETIVEYYDKLLSENGVSLEDFDCIYVMNNMLDDFAIYISIKGVRYKLCRIVYKSINI